ncbi:MAG: Holliday junction resolvase RuvX [Bacteroidaceae bacterium]|jgi:putative Holliday junction resolvase|nr:Holliday junction resolvase RuvX [Bacteroidaceae bacterium]
MPRLLSIDYGKKRTGIAVTDPLKLIANGLCTVETSKLMTFLKDYCAKESVERFVVGLPTQTNGDASENQQRVRCFVGELKKQIPDIPVTFYDERFTSVLAHRAILDSGVGKQRRRDKELVDTVAATIILQDYMSSQEHSLC